MPTFHFRAYDARGQYAQGRLDALSKDAAQAALWLRGLTPFELKPGQTVATPWWRREILTSRASTAAQLAFLTRELATLRGADIAVDEALRILLEQVPNGKLRGVVDALLADVLNGVALSDSMQRHPSLFPSDYVSALRAGEAAGTSAEVLQDLARLLERRVELSARVRSALVYPLVLLGMAIASVGTIVGVLVPTLAPLFADSGKPMPGALRVLSELQAHWPQLLLVTMFAVFMIHALRTALIRRPFVRLALDRAYLRLPVVGALLLQQDTAKFARCLGTLLKAGVPLLAALAAASDGVSNSYLRRNIERACRYVGEGRSLHIALRAEAELPSLATRLISVGEEAGKLDAMLLRAAEVLEQQVQRTLDRAMTLLTPVMTFGLALPIGGLMLTVMNALLSVNDLVAP